MCVILNETPQLGLLLLILNTTATTTNIMTYTHLLIQAI